MHKKHELKVNDFLFIVKNRAVPNFPASKICTQKKWPPPPWLPIISKSFNTIKTKPLHQKKKKLKCVLISSKVTLVLRKKSSSTSHHCVLVYKNVIKSSKIFASMQNWVKYSAQLILEKYYSHSDYFCTLKPMSRVTIGKLELGILFSKYLW